MNKPINDFTYGDSKAEITLARILTQRGNPRLTSFVTKTLTRLTDHLKNIQLRRDDLGTRSFLFNTIRAGYMEGIDNSLISKEDPEITTYLKNCIAKRLKKFLKSEFKNGKKKNIIESSSGEPSSRVSNARE